MCTPRNLELLTLSTAVLLMLSAHDCSFISKPDDVIRTELCSTVMSQQCEQQWTEYTALGGAGVLCGGAGGGAADPDRLGSVFLQVCGVVVCSSVSEQIPVFVLKAVPQVLISFRTGLAQFRNDMNAEISRRDMWSEQIFSADSWLVSLCAGMISSVVVVLFMTPFDVISTRLYNQPVDHLGKGKLYQGFMDCFSKTMKKEGVFGLYKGLGASYFRLGPHTILSLLFWNQLRTHYYS